MPTRGVRGATTVDENSAEAILTASRELLETLQAANGMRPDEVASVLFSVTPDLDSAYPARASREMGWTEVALLDVAQADIAGGLPRCIRVLVHWNTEREPTEIEHAYLRGAAVLRPEWAERPAQLEEAIGAELREVTLETGVPCVGPVAYQGEPGAYSQEAVFRRFGAQTDTLACRSFDDIFAAIESGRAAAGLLPVENSQAGSITAAYDLLLEHDLRVTGEVKLRVHHCLLAPHGTRLTDVRRVYSHPQALAQCERYLKNRGWEAVPAYDTAGSARALAESREPGAAAIASALAGQIYALDVMDNGIEDSADNATRFFVLGTEEPRRQALSKTSLVFATSHTPGALHRALGEFSSRGINLTKIESRPRRNQPWHYVFYLDLEGHWAEPHVEHALMRLLARAAFVKLLGSYPAAADPNED